MKKIACLGLAAMMAISVAGCSKNTEETSSEVAQQEASPAQEVSPSPSEETNVLLLSDKDFKPFIEALFSFSEEQYDMFNQNPSTQSAGYYENLNTYKKDMKAVLGKYLSEDTLDKLKDSSIRLDFDLPKKVQINDFVADAKGEVKTIEVKSSRQLGDEFVYELAVTTTNHVIPYNQFVDTYGWSEQLGYYQKAELCDPLAWLDLVKSSEMPAYIYPQEEGVKDAIKMVSSYLVYVMPDEDGQSFKITKVKQAGSLEVDETVKQKITNANYVERIPYYEEVADSDKALVGKVMKTMMTEPRETYGYYEKVYNESFELVQSFWKDIGLGNDIAVAENTYRQAFDLTMSPYKDKDEKITYDETKLKIVPSIYSTKVQPSFVVTVPVSILEKDNEQVYVAYKYFVETENSKVEAVQFMKRVELTEDEYTNSVEAAGDEGAEAETAAPIETAETAQ